MNSRTVVHWKQLKLMLNKIQMSVFVIWLGDTYLGHRQCIETVFHKVCVAVSCLLQFMNHGHRSITYSTASMISFLVVLGHFSSNTEVAQKPKVQCKTMLI